MKRALQVLGGLEYINKALKELEPKKKSIKIPVTYIDTSITLCDLCRHIDCDCDDQYMQWREQE